MMVPTKLKSHLHNIFLSILILPFQVSPSLSFVDDSSEVDITFDKKYPLCYTSSCVREDSYQCKEGFFKLTEITNAKGCLYDGYEYVYCCKEGYFPDCYDTPCRRRPFPVCKDGFILRHREECRGVQGVMKRSHCCLQTIHERKIMKRKDCFWSKCMKANSDEEKCPSRHELTLDTMDGCNSDTRRRYYCCKEAERGSLWGLWKLLFDEVGMFHFMGCMVVVLFGAALYLDGGRCLKYLPISSYYQVRLKINKDEVGGEEGVEGEDAGEGEELEEVEITPSR